MRTGTPVRPGELLLFTSFPLTQRVVLAVCINQQQVLLLDEKRVLTIRNMYVPDWQFIEFNHGSSEKVRSYRLMRGRGEHQNSIWVGDFLSNVEWV